VGDEQAARECARAPDLVAPTSGCATLVYTATEGGCSLRSAGDVVQAIPGGWIRLMRDPLRATSLRVRLIDGADDCDATGDGCPTMHLTTGGAAPCACDTETLHSFSISRTEPFEWPVFAPEPYVMLGPNRATFEVSLCVGDGDPFPTCAGASAEPSHDCQGFGALVSGGRCACRPPCAAVEDCPRTASAAALRCEGGACILGCATDADCPTGQLCTTAPDGAQICMSPL
jgi:hypothetical protein